MDLDDGTLPLLSLVAVPDGIDKRAARKAYKRAYDRAHAEVRNARAREYRRTHLEQVLARERAHYHRHAQKRRAARRAYRQAHPEQCKAAIDAWRKAHPESVRAWNRASSARNRAKINARGKRYRTANPEKVRLRHQIYNATHREGGRQRVARRRARMAGTPRNDFTAAQWREMKEAYGHRCVYCGRKMQRLTMDHIVPLAKGGAHTYSNIVPACGSCNSQKGTKPPPVPIQPLLLTLSPSRSAS